MLSIQGAIRHLKVVTQHILEEEYLVDSTQTHTDDSTQEEYLVEVSACAAPN